MSLINVAIRELLDDIQTTRQQILRDDMKTAKTPTATRKPAIARITGILILGVMLCLALNGCSLSDILGTSKKGELSGVVYNDAGSQVRLAGVTILIGGRRAESNSNGEYSIDDLTTGDQKLSASKPGFRTYTATVKIYEKGTDRVGANRFHFYMQYEQ